MAQVRVGISGWRYRSWRGDFYPSGLPQRRELEYAAERLSTVEINGSFYSLQRPESYQRWRASVPGEFVFAVKGSRYITHMLRLRNARSAMANFFASGVLALGPTLGPVLWQLPEREVFNPHAWSEFLEALPKSTGAALALAREHDERLDGRTWLEIDEDVPMRHAVEPRSPSYADPAFAHLLRTHRVGLAVADSAGRWPTYDEVTADFVYIRLHRSRELYHSGYTPAELDDWASRIRGWADGTGTGDGMPRDVYVYFDNDALGHAPHDAEALQARMREALAPGGA